MQDLDVGNLAVYGSCESAHLLVVNTVLALLAICAPLRSQPAAPDQTITAIQETIESRKYIEALGQVSAALAAYPQDGGLYNLRGVIHAEQNDMIAAREDFQRAVTLSPELIPAWQNLARACQFDLGKARADSHCAADAWRRVLKVRPDDPEARFSLAAIYEQQGQYAGSLRELENLPPAEISRSTALAVRCADLAGLDRLKEAGEMAKRLAESPEFSEADVRSILPQLETPARAPILVTLVEALDARGTVSPGLLRSLVIAYEQLNRLPEARKILERLAATDPQNPLHLFELARVAYKQHDLEGSLGYLGHARDLVPSDPQVHFLFGMILEEMQLPLEARKSVEKAVALDPKNPDYNYGLGSIILITREAGEAVACFRNYVAARPGDPRGHFALGVAYFATGDYANCRKEMQFVSKDPATEAGASYFLGRVARMEENLSEAAAFFDRSIRLLPSFPDSYAELARVRLRQGRLEDARSAIDHALSLDPDNFQANSMLLALYEKTHDARAEQQRAKLQTLDELRSKRQELMLRSIEVRPY